MIAGSLLITGTAYSKTITQNIAVRFAQIQLFANGEPVKTAAEPFIYKNNVYAPMETVAKAMGIQYEWDNKTSALRFSNHSQVPKKLWEEAAIDNYPVTYDPTDPKSIPPKLQLLNDTYINLSGKSKTEFLVIYSYTSFEDVTSATYVSLFQNDKGKARRISTLKLFDAKDIKELWREQDVVYNDKTQQILAFNHAMKITQTGVGKGDVLEACIIGYKDRKLVKVSDIKK
nr:stalk domain-containing protein [Brevibacillus halotolerans]